MVFSDSSAVQPSLTVTATGQYGFRLTVSDQTLSNSDEVTVVVSAADNVRPQASAGSDRERYPLARSWFSTVRAAAIRTATTTR